MADPANAKAAKQSFRDLKVWQKSMELTTVVYRLSQGLPREETFGLTSQLRRSAVSIASNIAEGHGRMSRREFKRFLLIARGSNCELQTQLEVVENLRLSTGEMLNKAKGLAEEIENMLFALLSRIRNNSS